LEKPGNIRCYLNTALHAAAMRLLSRRPWRHGSLTFGVRIGGDDQAWLYREEMRDVWDATSDALEWLRKASKRRK
jgi:hypothetical protein